MSPGFAASNIVWSGCTSSSFVCSRLQLPLRGVCAHESRNFALTKYPSRRILVSCSASNQELVSDVLNRLQRLDSHPSTSSQNREEINILVQELKTRAELRPHLKDPSIFDEYSVSFVYSKELLNPAGGIFRSGVGRVIFRERGTFQHVIKPNCIINLVAFQLFGFVPGSVMLQGKFTVLDDSEIGSNGLRVDFMPPRIALMGVVFQFGKPSQVQLRTVYLDERVRIGLGSRGSVFVFARLMNDASTVSKEWKPMVQDSIKPLPAMVLPLFLVAIILASAYLPLQIAALIWLLFVILSLRARRSFMQVALS